MSSESKTVTREAASLGRYISVQFDAAPDGLSFSCDQYGDLLICTPLMPGRPSPRPNETVRCVGGMGAFTAVVEGSDEEKVVLRAPDWVWRHVERAAVRVATHHPVTLLGQLEGWAAHLVDLSATGAAVILEPWPGMSVGEEIACRLPAGPAGAEIRSMRQAGYGRLTVAGLRWTWAEAEVRTWIRAQVAAERTRWSAGSTPAPPWIPGAGSAATETRT